MKALTQAELYKALSSLIKSGGWSTGESLIDLLHDLSPVGYPPLVKACTKYSELKTYPERALSLRLAINRVCGRSDRPLVKVEERFSPLEYPHLLDQLRALLTDLELYIIADPSTVQGLSWRLWIDVCRALLKELGSEERSRLALILAGLSDELGHMVELDIALLEREGPKLMARHLKALQRGGGFVLPAQGGRSERDEVVLITSSGVERHQGHAWSPALVSGREQEVMASFVMIHCPEGELWMGSEERVGSSDEHPRHRVRICRPLLVSQTLVTQSLFEAVMKWNPSRFKGEQRPVEHVSWYHMVRFCNALSELEGFRPAYGIDDTGEGSEPTVSLDLSANGYRLPTEAEWEYVAKAGDEHSYAGSEELDEVAWFKENSGRQTHPVAQKKPNAWGLYDMSGNTLEWCSDQWDADAYKPRSAVITNPSVYSSSTTRRVVRGGCWGHSADECRVAYRQLGDARYRGSNVGGRLLRRRMDT